MPPPLAARYRAHALSSHRPSPQSIFGLSHVYTGPALANWIHYDAIFACPSAQITACKPTAHCNRSRDPVDLLQKLRLRRKPLRPALQHLVSISISMSISIYLQLYTSIIRCLQSAYVHTKEAVSYVTPDSSRLRKKHTRFTLKNISNWYHLPGLLFRYL